MAKKKNKVSKARKSDRKYTPVVYKYSCLDLTASRFATFRRVMKHLADNGAVPSSWATATFDRLADRTKLPYGTPFLNEKLVLDKMFIGNIYRNNLQYWNIKLIDQFHSVNNNPDIQNLTNEIDQLSAKYDVLLRMKKSNNTKIAYAKHKANKSGSVAKTSDLQQRGISLQKQLDEIYKKREGLYKERGELRKKNAASDPSVCRAQLLSFEQKKVVKKLIRGAYSKAAPLAKSAKNMLSKVPRLQQKAVADAKAAYAENLSKGLSEEEAQKALEKDLIKADFIPEATQTAIDLILSDSEFLSRFKNDSTPLLTSQRYHMVDPQCERSYKDSLFTGGSPSYTSDMHNGAITLEVKASVEDLLSGAKNHARLYNLSDLTRDADLSVDPSPNGRNRRLSLSNVFLLDIDGFTYIKGKGSRKKCRLSVPFIMHRPFPPDAKIRSVCVYRSLSPQGRVRYSLHFDVDAPTLSTREAKAFRTGQCVEPTTESPRIVGIDVGWRQAVSEDNKDLKVMHMYDGTNSMSITLPSVTKTIGDDKKRLSVVDRLNKSNSVKSALDSSLEGIKLDILECFNRSNNHLPDLLKKEKQHLHKKKSIKKIRQLYRLWTSNRFYGDDVAYFALEIWLNKTYPHLKRWVDCERSRALGCRDEFYRNIAAKLTEIPGSKIVIEDLSTHGMGKAPTKGKAKKQAGVTQRKNKSISAPYKFKMILKHFASKNGCEVIEVNTANTSKTCHVCGVITSLGSEEVYTCSCGATWNRDDNAAKNIRARGLEVISTKIKKQAPASGPVLIESQDPLAA